jgi:protein-S-isoprenylcysteine O-methyltransferase Ste14
LRAQCDAVEAENRTQSDRPALAGDLSPGFLLQPNASAGAALAIDTGLINIWSLQNAGMASRSFKRRSHAFVPAPLERAFYCLMTAAVLFVLVYFWVPIPFTIHQLEPGTFASLVEAAFWAVWGLFILSVIADRYLGFFGLKQTWCYLIGRPFVMSSFKTNHFHRFVRHPSLSFLILGFWITPQMTIDRLLLAVLMTIYTVIGAHSVDRKFLRYYGQDYAWRQKEVPLLVPRLLTRMTRAGS